MKRCVLLLPVVFLMSCAGSHDALVVKQLYLRDQLYESGDEPMIRAEKQRRLHGAVSMAERREALGQYYTVLWQNEGAGPVEVVFEYQQGATASLVKRQTAAFDAGETHGKAEFSVIGDNYFRNGKVLTWKVSLKRGGGVIATKQSYLWSD